MSVAYYDLIKDITTRVHTEIKTNLNYDVKYSNSNPPKAANSLWIRSSVTLGDTLQVSIGSNPRFRTVGILNLQVFGVLGKGEKEALEAAQACATLFRGISIGSTVYRSPSVTVKGRENKWYSLLVQCPFQHDSFKL